MGAGKTFEMIAAAMESKKAVIEQRDRAEHTSPEKDKKSQREM